MGLFDFLSNGKKQVVNEQQFEERSKAHAEGLDIFNELYQLHGGGSDLMRLDYWFYTDEMEKAEALSEDLKRLRYEVYVQLPEREEKRICISGRTIFMKDEKDAMENWVMQMNELGFIHDCEFDGWGAPCSGWFSDETPDEKIRQQLRLPPREDQE